MLTAGSSKDKNGVISFPPVRASTGSIGLKSYDSLILFDVGYLYAFLTAKLIEALKLQIEGVVVVPLTQT